MGSNGIPKEIVSHAHPDTPILESGKSDFGSAKNLVPLGCFGPFPRNWAKFPSSNLAAHTPIFNTSTGHKVKPKKRKRDKSRNTSPIIITAKKRLNTQPHSSSTPATPNSNTLVVDDLVATTTPIELVSISSSDQEDATSKSIEAKKTAAVGKEETQLTNHERIDIRGCWGDQDYDREGVDSEGRSGGIVSIWDKSCFRKSEIIKAKNYLIIKGTWVDNNQDIVFANIYGPHELTDQKRLWRDLITIKNNLEGKWIFFGDFNAVRRSGERFNSNFCPASASAFNDFIHEIDLHDFTMGGENFTFMSRVDAKLSKLDRFMACSGFTTLFPHLTVIAQPRELSDHCPITLSSLRLDFGPPPF
ncbi:hypothetical protein L2E82_39970 [Cichorium intybus]|uniref:Uncharacterized protein n=1 Tax=Cichorium intybus TaxID=13427 RepID=A0ACB9AJQ6_CICIN|nr:hypothetical protein L2E82_39970 [Cichorium intybus]